MAAKKKASKRPMKGEAGKKTGPSTRKAIKDQKKKGSTGQDIARATRRDPKTISDIELGVIKNPPKNVKKLVKKAKTSSSKPVKKTMASKKKRLAHKK
jgi:hypothetical protein